MSSDPQRASKRLLVVTDDPQVRDELEYGFPADFDIDLATDAREAWARMTDDAPEAVIVDLQTGSAGGYGLARDMSENTRLAQVPVVMLLERLQDEWLAKQAGAASWVVKPVSAEHLLRTLTDRSKTA